MGQPEQEAALPPWVEIVLVRPRIPPNVGNVARTCAAFGVPLHIIGADGLRLDAASVRRAGVDCWSQLEVHCHRDLDEVVALCGGRPVAFTRRGEGRLDSFSFCRGDLLVFGPEDRGLGPSELARCARPCVRIPHGPQVRSLNLATSVGIALWAALVSLGAVPAAPEAPPGRG